MVIIRDLVHGDIELSRRCMDVIKTAEFQRLRKITQNGFLQFIFPTMTHSRFQHALGVSYLSLKYFNELVSEAGRRIGNGKQDYIVRTNFTILKNRTHSAYTFSDDSEKDFWADILSLAGLCHDLGHGPFSHTFETLGFLKEEDFLPDNLQTTGLALFLSEARKCKGYKFEHEDISVFYIDLIFNKYREANHWDLKTSEQFEKFTIAVACLIHKHIRQKVIGSHRSSSLKTFSDIEIDRLELFGQIISGLIDADRLDYIQRDSTMAGVRYGMIEQDRLIRNFFPVLVKDFDSVGVALVGQADSIHALDHFLVCLFEMYTQLYHNKTNMRFAAQFKQIIELEKQSFPPTIDLSMHSKLTEDKFLQFLSVDALNAWNDLVSRREVEDSPKCGLLHEPTAGLIAKLEKQGLKVHSNVVRPVIKDAVAVLLEEEVPQNNSPQIFEYKYWEASSLVAKRLDSHKFNPTLWLRSEKLDDLLKKLHENSVKSVS